MTLSDEESEDSRIHDEDLSTSSIVAIVRRVSELKDLPEEEIEEWIQIDCGDLGYQVLTEDEMVKMFNLMFKIALNINLFLKVLGENEQETTEVLEVEELSDGQEQKREGISHQQAKDAADILLQYLEEQADTEMVDIMHLRKIKNCILSNVRKSQKQRKITDFYKV